MGVVVIFSVILEIVRSKRLKKYWLRSCTGREWRRHFPDSPKEDIRSFLKVFIDCFGFSVSKRLKFSPNDKVMDVYKTLYPTSRGDDLMELESFLLRLAESYGEDVADAFTPDSTLGDIFMMTRRINPNQTIEATS